MKYLRKIRIPKLDKKTTILFGITGALLLINLIALFGFILPAAKNTNNEQLQKPTDQSPAAISPLEEYCYAITRSVSRCQG